MSFCEACTQYTLLLKYIHDIMAIKKYSSVQHSYALYMIHVIH